MAVTQLPFTFIDYSSEKSTVSLNAAAILADGSNWAAVVSGVGSNRALLGAALNTMTLMNETLSAVNIAYAKTAEVLPAEGADREFACRIIYQDDVTLKKYRFDIPAPITGIWKPNSDELDLTDVIVAAFVLVFEANVLSEVGNAVTILEGYKVGRNN